MRKIAKLMVDSLRGLPWVFIQLKTILLFREEFTSISALHCFAEGLGETVAWYRAEGAR